MPYIDEKLRERYDKHIDALYEALQRNGGCGGELHDVHPGHVNYIISRLLWSLFRDREGYTRANLLIGVLEAVKQEFYLRKVQPYEEAACESNGDVELCPHHEGWRS